MNLEEIFSIYKRDNKTGVKLLEEYLESHMLDTKVVYTLFGYYVNTKNYGKAAHYLDLLRQTDINMYDYYTYLTLINELLDLGIDLSNIKMNDLLIPKSDEKYDDIKGNNEVRKEIFKKFYYNARIENNRVFHKKGHVTLEESIITDLINANVKKAEEMVIKCIEEGNYEEAYKHIHNVSNAEMLAKGLKALVSQSQGMLLNEEILGEIEKAKKTDDKISSSLMKAIELEDNVNKTLHYQNETDYFYLYIEKMDEFYEDEQAMQSLVRDYLADYSKMEYYDFIMKIYEELSKDVFFDYIYSILYGVDRSYLVRKYEETNDETYNEIISLIPVVEKEDIVKKIEKLLS